MSTAFRSTAPLAPPWNARRRLKPWLPTYETSSTVFDGSPNCMPACHCHDEGSCALYWKSMIAGTPVVLRPVPSVCSWPLRRSCDVEIGGLPGMEDTVVSSGRSVLHPATYRSGALRSDH